MAGAPEVVSERLHRERQRLGRIAIAAVLRAAGRRPLVIDVDAGSRDERTTAARSRRWRRRRWRRRRRRCWSSGTYDYVGAQVHASGWPLNLDRDRVRPATAVRVRRTLSASRPAIAEEPREVMRAAREVVGRRE